MNKLYISILCVASLFLSACNNDDEPKIPTDAIALNMITGNNNTTIGGSDVYINSSLNFATSYCGIADLGKKGAFNANPSLNQLAQEVAVTPGNFYQITLARDIQSVAGARAYPVDASYYNVYVDSWIYDKNNDIDGAKIQYVESYPSIKELPQWDSVINLTLRPKKDDVNVEVAEYSFPNKCKIDDDISVYGVNNSSLKDVIEIKIDENRISFRNAAWTPGGEVEVTMLVRYESVYTRVNLKVKSSQ
ncbi:MAG: DUF5036 family protein [Paramuribaculum sp.]|nr:DUF5036 family protein [Paramuribaculum sp.]MDE6303347.1 DUF5036 family protein [Paramuribaculum sp.]